MFSKDMSRQMRRKKKFAWAVIIVAASALVLTSVLSYVGLRSWSSPPVSDPVATEKAELQQRISRLKGSLERNPDNIYFLTQLGTSYFDLGRIYQYLNDDAMGIQNFVAAVELYGTVLEAEPGNVDVRVNRAAAAFRAGFFELAREEFELSLELDPAHLYAHYSYGVFLLFGLQNPAEAITRFERVLELNSSDPQMVLAVRQLMAQAEQALNNPAFDSTPRGNN